MPQLDAIGTVSIAPPRRVDRIGEVTFDLTLAEPTPEIPDAEVLAVLVQDDLLSVVEDVVTNWNAGGDHDGGPVSITFDTIEVDLGHWAQVPDMFTIKQTLHSALKAALDAAIPQVADGFSPQLEQSSALTGEPISASTRNAPVSHARSDRSVADNSEAQITWPVEMHGGAQADAIFGRASEEHGTSTTDSNREPLQGAQAMTAAEQEALTAPQIMVGPDDPEIAESATADVEFSVPLPYENLPRAVHADAGQLEGAQSVDGPLSGRSVLHDLEETSPRTSGGQGALREAKTIEPGASTGAILLTLWRSDPLALADSMAARSIPQLIALWVPIAAAVAEENSRRALVERNHAGETLRGAGPSASVQLPKLGLSAALTGVAPVSLIADYPVQGTDHRRMIAFAVLGRSKSEAAMTSQSLIDGTGAQTWPNSTSHSDEGPSSSDKFLTAHPPGAGFPVVISDTALGAASQFEAEVTSSDLPPDSRAPKSGSAATGTTGALANAPQTDDAASMFREAKEKDNSSTASFAKYGDSRGPSQTLSSTDRRDPARDSREVPASSTSNNSTEKTIFADSDRRGTAEATYSDRPDASGLSGIALVAQWRNAPIAFRAMLENASAETLSQLLRMATLKTASPSFDVQSAASDGRVSAKDLQAALLRIVTGDAAYPPPQALTGSADDKDSLPEPHEAKWPGGANVMSDHAAEGVAPPAAGEPLRTSSEVPARRSNAADTQRERTHGLVCEILDSILLVRTNASDGEPANGRNFDLALRGKRSEGPSSGAEDAFVSPSVRSVAHKTSGGATGQVPDAITTPGAASGESLETEPEGPESGLGRNYAVPDATSDERDGYAGKEYRVSGRTMSRPPDRIGPSDDKQEASRPIVEVKDAGRAALDFVSGRPVDPGRRLTDARALSSDPFVLESGNVRKAEAPAFAAERFSIDDALEAEPRIGTGGLADTLTMAALTDPAAFAAALADPSLGLVRTDRLLALLPPHQLQHLLAAMTPGFGSKEVTVLRTLWQGLNNSALHEDILEAMFWRCAVSLAGGALPRGGGVTGLVSAVLRSLAPDKARRENLAEAIAQRLDGTPSIGPAAAIAQVAAALAGEGARTRPAPARGMAPSTHARSDARGTIAGRARTLQENVRETVHLITDAAGLVLLAPYLPVLFRRLDLLEGNAFRDDAAVFRALAALSALLRGAVPSQNPLRPRPLERCLCGLPEGMTLPPQGEPDAEVLEMANGLLGSVLGQWTAVGKTSVSGLREAFLQRQGTLTLNDGAWRLVVEPKGWDVLIDQLPWGFRLVRYPWMPEPIHVNWRGGNA